MAKYIFNVIGENSLLAISELKALFETYNLKFSIIEKREQFLIIQLNAREDLIKKISGRSALLRSSAVLKKKLNSLLISDLEKVKWSSWVKSPFQYFTWEIRVGIGKLWLVIYLPVPPIV